MILFLRVGNVWRLSNFKCIKFTPISLSAYYKAYVKDVFPESTEVLLRFERDWQPESRFPVARVRLPPPAPASGSASEAFKEGDEIEVFSRASDQVNLQFILSQYYHGEKILTNC